MDCRNKVIRVLLIEDNPDDAFLVNELFTHDKGTRCRYQFIHRERLDDAIEYAHTHSVDIAVLDLSLPDSSDLDTLDRFTQMVADVPVVVFTSLNDPEYALKVVARGAQDYIIKGQLDANLFEKTLLYGIERHRIRAEYLHLAEELKTLNSLLERQILLDSLTGLLNRRGLQEALTREIERSQRGETDLLALILDLDNFKQINDTLGHAAGDVTLKEISQKIAQVVRSTDYVARIGGDEFMILMPQTRFAEGMLVAGKIRRAISGSQAAHSFESKFQVTASLGLTSVSPDIVTVEEILSKTHNVLYKSKKNGKNRVSYDDGSQSREHDDSDGFSGVLNALKSDRGYHVVKQPIYNLKENKRVGYEFLSRFTVKGLEMPDDFFRVCQENNILSMVDRHCFKNCMSLGAQFSSELSMHINLFPSTIIDTPVKSLMQSLGSETNYKNYCIEISEQQIIGDPSYLAAPIKALRQYGLQIAIDDVGFGRSCLESLILLEPDIVKIDKKWVNGISRNPVLEKSLRRLTKLTSAIGSDLVAEGIETEADMEVLKGIGITYGQGYYLGRPE